MDFLIAPLVEFLFEAPTGAVMECKRLKPWEKTLFVLVLGLFISVMLAYGVYIAMYVQPSIAAAIVMSILTIAWTIFAMWMAITGHKRKWKND